MLVDKTFNSSLSYTYHIIQIKSFTHELFNVGVVMFDAAYKKYSFFAKVQAKASCIQIQDAQNINFLLSSLKDAKELNTDNLTDISITAPKVFTTNLQPQQALDKLVDTYISIKPFMQKTVREFNIYDKREIHKSLREYARNNDIANFVAGKHFNIAYKPIDMALLDASEKPYSIAAMTSPHVDNFKDGFIANIFTLQESIKKSTTIKNSFLYAPVFDNVNNISKNSLSEHIGWAKEQAQEYKFDILTDSRESAAMEMLQQ